jgi:hypothetical protein
VCDNKTEWHVYRVLQNTRLQNHKLNSSDWFCWLRAEKCRSITSVTFRIQFTALVLVSCSDRRLESCYTDANKSLARPTSRCILFDGENISFDASLVIYVYINSTNIPPIMFINRIYENQNLLSLYLVSFLVGLRTYQYPCIKGVFVLYDRFMKLLQNNGERTKVSRRNVMFIGKCKKYAYT